jgi:serine/threonine protein kinase
MTDKVIETNIVNCQMNNEGVPSHVNDYKIIKMLGEGSFGKVYQCHNSKGEEYALKILNKSILKRKKEYKKVDGKMFFSNAFQKVQREVAIMKKLCHKHLVKLYEVSKCDNTVTKVNTSI